MKFINEAKRSLSRGLWVLSVAAAITACSSGGGSSDDGSSNQRASGTFVDSRVAGLRYVSGSISGITDENGRFEYEVGEEVSFSIGDIELGSAPGAPVITPLELAGEGAEITDPIVVNILKLLQTLDDDADPGNGIQITELVQSMAQGDIDFDVDPDDFIDDGAIQDLIDELTAATLAGARDLIDTETALAHFMDSRLAFEYAGSYSGTFDGDDDGSWSFDIGPDGFVVTDSDGNFVEGSVNSNGLFVGVTDEGCEFEGSISDAGVISGEWTCDFFGETGEFEGEGDDVDVDFPEDFSGVWQIDYTETANSCEDGSDASLSVTIDQDGYIADVEFAGAVIPPSLAVIEGNALSWFAVYDDDGGITTESVELHLDAGGLSGISNWEWIGTEGADAGEECDGSGVLTGTCTAGDCLSVSS